MTSTGSLVAIMISRGSRRATSRTESRTLVGRACGLVRKACELFSLSASSQAPSNRVQGVWMPPEPFYRFRASLFKTLLLGFFAGIIMNT